MKKARKARAVQSTFPEAGNWFVDFGDGSDSSLMTQARAEEIAKLFNAARKPAKGLRPCPFCGGANILVNCEDDQGHQAACQDCGAVGPSRHPQTRKPTGFAYLGGKKAKARAAWNVRT